MTAATLLGLLLVAALPAPRRALARVKLARLVRP